ncbi:hypothetical protein BaRGS_00012260 [Batillaria attramentaria]|uniref:COMM domain-containing protein 5 n=1 Tax=Batillaria attramentaria TaxID=370345 RepID=A0ABD0LBK7_9CAEN
MSIVQVQGGGGRVVSDRTSFVGVRVPPEIKAMVKLLAKLDSDIFKKLLKLVVQSLEGEVNYNKFQTIVQGAKNKPAEETLGVIYTGLLSLVRCALRHSTTSLKQQHFKEDLEELGLHPFAIFAATRVVPDFRTMVSNTILSMLPDLTFSGESDQADLKNFLRGGLAYPRGVQDPSPMMCASVPGWRMPSMRPNVDEMNGALLWRSSRSWGSPPWWSRTAQQQGGHSTTICKALLSQSWASVSLAVKPVPTTVPVPKEAKPVGACEPAVPAEPVASLPGIPAGCHEDLASCVFGSKRTTLDKRLLDSRPRLPHLVQLKWRVDVAISTSVLNRVLEPSIIMEMTFSDGHTKVFEVPVSQFHQLRYSVAYVLRQMEELEKRSILKIQD